MAVDSNFLMAAESLLDDEFVRLFTPVTNCHRHDLVDATLEESIE